MRCFFHLVNGAETILDDTGVDVPNLDGAKASALRAISELLRESDDVLQDWAGWQLHIVCSRGNILASIPLCASLH
ncbi:hypothetical protein GR328_08365 [Microvirga makkahensis]|uniref:DUF6894 domain-containing protein n=2 Tax=Microvirga makkahensis TaxID=1128670 RepID=A0A7X3MQN8_9HYPH|nr:hypothetical protein [Microvirga makkahensis]MXQ11472.1 hypothetical protein [Microvirga makkahensis]